MVPGLFSAEDRDSDCNDIHPVAKKDKPREFNDTPDSLWKYLADRVRDQLRFVPFLGPDRLPVALEKVVVAMLSLDLLNPLSANLEQIAAQETLPTEPVLMITTPGAAPSQE